MRVSERLFLAVFATCALAAHGALTLFDFETPQEIACAPEGIGVLRDIFPFMSAKVAEIERECAAMREAKERDESYWRFREACAKAGQPAGTYSGELVVSTDYTRDPAVVLRWRDAMADLVEQSK